MHRQLVGEFHHQANHKWVEFPAIFQEIRHPIRVGDWFGDTIELTAIHLDNHVRISQDVPIPVRL